MLRILFVAHSKNRGSGGNGIFTFIDTQVRALNRRGVRCYTIINDDVDLALVRKSGLNIEIVLPNALRYHQGPIPSRSVQSKFRIFYYSLRRRLQILGIARRLTRADLIEVPDFRAEGLFLLLLRRKLLVRMHGPQFVLKNYDSYNRSLASRVYSTFVGYLELFCLNASSRVVSCSQRLIDDLPQWLRNRQSIVQVNNGIESGYWSQKCGGRRRRRSVLFVGPPSHLKGLSILIEALSGPSFQSLGVTVTLVGFRANEMPEEQMLQLKRAGVQTVFSGQAGPLKLRQLYQSHEITCIPSRYECQPFVALEAMAAGSLVVASSVGDLPRMVEHGVSGYLFETGDSRQLARTILDAFARSEDEVERMSLASQVRIAEKHDIDLLADKNLKVLLNLADC